MAKQIKKSEEEKDLKKGKKNPKKNDNRSLRNNHKEERVVKSPRKEKEVKEEKIEIEKEVMKEEKFKEVETKVVENKDSSKKKTILSTIIVIVSILLIVGAFVISVIETNEKSKYYNEISFNEVSELMAGEEVEIIYWASPNCSYCSMFTPVVKNVSYDNKLTFNYLNTANLNDEEYAKMYDHFVKFDSAYFSRRFARRRIS